ncbi:hypothetical protein [Candidatus Tisiphia endosymbiont of Psammoecus bipunctatus]|uniref:hypothetical protein n=1 Tax=Candidatus Tisiphia endosymbiont of Psammoecus bipunctatus TaxID=3139333 RepID=UPI0035C896A3
MFYLKNKGNVMIFLKKINQNLFFLIFLCLFLNGCTHQIISTVTVFHKDFDINQRKFIILPLGNQKDSLEFQQYAKLVAEQLNNSGLTEIHNQEQANYMVYFSYGMLNREKIVESFPVYGYVQGDTTYHSGSISSYNSGSSYYTGSSYTPQTLQRVGTEVATHIVYTLGFDLNIYLNNDGNDAIKVYEGKVTNIGNIGDFFIVGKCLILALFKDFPGRDGSREVVEIPSEHCMTN